MTIKLKRLIESVIRSSASEAANYIFIEIDERMLKAHCPEVLLAESMWKDAPIKGYSYRLDPANPNIPVRRHVTIAHSQQTSAKNKQVSWNDDGSRHDRGTFDTNFHGINKAKEIARQVLRLPRDVKLEHLHSPADAILLLEGVNEIPEESIVLRARSPKRRRRLTL